MTKSVTMTSDVNSEAEQQPPFATLIGMNIIHVSKDKIVAELPVREELNNRFGALHGGAVMALADKLGGTATQFAERRTHGDYREQDEFLRQHSRWGRRPRRVHAAPSWPHHDGVADARHAQ